MGFGVWGWGFGVWGLGLGFRCLGSNIALSVLAALSRSSRDMNTKGFIQASGIAGYREAADPDATLLDETSALQ